MHFPPCASTHAFRSPENGTRLVHRELLAGVHRNSGERRQLRKLAMGENRRGNNPQHDAQSEHPRSHDPNLRLHYRQPTPGYQRYWRPALPALDVPTFSLDRLRPVSPNFQLDALLPEVFCGLRRHRAGTRPYHVQALQPGPLIVSLRAPNCPCPPPFRGARLRLFHSATRLLLPFASLGRGGGAFA